MADRDITGHSACENISIEVLDSLSYYPSDKFFIGIFMPILLVIGITGNIAFIVVVARLPSMRTSTNCYLVHLAIADVVFLIFGMGEKVWVYSAQIYDNNASVLGPIFGCVLFPLISDISYFASLCFITLVSSERYIAVCRPQSRGLFQRSGFTGLMCIVSWVVSTLISSTLIPGNWHYDYHCLILPDEEPYRSYPAEWARCIPRGSFDTWRIYTNLIQTLPFFLSLLFNVYLFCRIVKGLNQSIKRLRGHGGTKKDEDTRIRDQIARMLILNGVIFFCCLAPFEIISLVLFVHVTGGRTVQWVSNISRALSYFNSVVNPIIFTTMSQRYREAFRVTFLSKRCAGTDDSLSTNGASPSTTNTYIRMTKPKP